MGRKRTPDTDRLQYQDTYSKCGCENFEIRGTTKDE